MQGIGLTLFHIPDCSDVCAMSPCNRAGAIGSRSSMSPITSARSRSAASVHRSTSTRFPSCFEHRVDTAHRFVVGNARLLAIHGFLHVGTKPTVTAGRLFVGLEFGNDGFKHGVQGQQASARTATKCPDRANTCAVGQDQARRTHTADDAQKVWRYTCPTPAPGLRESVTLTYRSKNYQIGSDGL